MAALDDVNLSGLCLCGCGGLTTIATMTAKRRKGCVQGYPQRFIFGHYSRHRRLAVSNHYRKVEVRSGSGKAQRKRIHRLRAERALGKPLPPMAVVHHADGTRSEQSALVICQDQAYHHLLHARMRVKAAGGDPNTEAVCTTCRGVKPRSEFNANRLALGVGQRCRPCIAIANRFYRQRKRGFDLVKLTKAGAA